MSVVDINELVKEIDSEFYGMKKLNIWYDFERYISPEEQNYNDLVDKSAASAKLIGAAGGNVSTTALISVVVINVIISVGLGLIWGLINMI